MSLGIPHYGSYADTSQWNKLVGGDAAEVGSGPGSYDIRKSVWHVNVSRPARVWRSPSIP